MTALKELLREYARFEWTADLSDISAEAKYEPKGSYVYLMIAARGGVEFPLYVGETGELSRRLREYIKPQFSASTDFRVGMVVRGLRTRGCSIFFLYAQHPIRKPQEKLLIDKLLLLGYPLLNSLSGFDYKKDAGRKAEIETSLGRFCDMVVEQAALRAAGGSG